MQDEYDEEERIPDHSEETYLDIDSDVSTKSKNDNRTDDYGYDDDIEIEYYDDDDDDDDDDGFESSRNIGFISKGTKASEALRRAMREKEDAAKEYERDVDEDDDLDEDSEESFLADISSSLKTQVHEELGIIDEDDENDIESEYEEEKSKKPLKYRILKTTGIILGILLLTTMFLAFTKPGQGIVIRLMAKVARASIGDLSDYEDTEPYVPPTDIPLPTDAAVITPPEVIKTGEPRHEEYVVNCLLIGIEELDGARNTDSMMIASINTKTKEITLVSLMRDTYVDIPDYNGKPVRGNKLNAVYAKGVTREEGARLLIDTIERNFHIKIDAYASVNFSAMERIVNMLGGVTIELTEREASYLRTTNYIADPGNRNVRSGVTTLNGGQVVGYCRVRYVPTVGGANNDYGRTLRQRKVLSAIFDKYKSKGITELISIGIKCLNEVKFDITEEQIVQVLTMIVDYKITEINSMRMPVEEGYYDSGKSGHNGITYALVMDKGVNTKELFKFIYGDTEEEAAENYEIYKEIYAE